MFSKLYKFNKLVMYLNSSSTNLDRDTNCQEILLRTILFSAYQNHGRRKRHATKGNFPKHPKGKHRCNETAMEE